MVGNNHLTVFPVAFVAQTCHPFDISAVALYFIVYVSFDGEGEAEIVVVEVELEAVVDGVLINEGSDLRIVPLHQL